MSYGALLAQTVTVRHYAAGAKDAHGNPAPAFDAGTAYPARLTQTVAAEDTADRQFELGDWHLYLPADAVIGGRDRVVDDAGRVFEVVGPPLEARTPAGVHHIEARLRHVDTAP